MPRIPKIDPCDCNQHSCPETSVPNPVYVDSAVMDIKLQLLEEKLVPRDLINNFPIKDISESAYVYVDDNGTSGRVLLYDILSKEIKWKDLSWEVQEKILIGLSKQDKLYSSDHIVITEDNRIVLSLTAADIGAITVEEAVIIINEKVALKVSELKPELKEEILIILDEKIAAAEGRLDEKIYEAKQEIIQMTDARIEARLGDIDAKIAQQINLKLQNAAIDGGLITLDRGR